MWISGVRSIVIRGSVVSWIRYISPEIIWGGVGGGVYMTHLLLHIIVLDILYIPHRWTLKHVNKPFHGYHNMER